MSRVTVATLRVLVGTLNDITGNQREPWADGKSVPGVYIIDSCYGGYRLSRIVNDGGAEKDITPRYGAAVTADLIRAYMAGIQEGKR